MQFEHQIPVAAPGLPAQLDPPAAMPMTQAAHGTSLVDLRFRHGFHHDTVVVSSGYVELDRRVGLTSNNGGPFAGIMHIPAAINSTLVIEAEALRARAWLTVGDIDPEQSVTIDLDHGQLRVSTEP